MTTIPSRQQIKTDLTNLLSKEGSLSPSEAYKKLADIWKLSNEERALERSGGFLYQHEIRWARQELKIQGIIAPDVPP